MPILPPEPDCFPDDLLEQVFETADDDPETHRWHFAYTKSRQEKSLMRQLRQLNVPHYGPQVPHRNRSPAGRVRTSLVPLFTNYVFLFGDRDQQIAALSTGCIIKLSQVADGQQLVDDLQQIKSLIAIDVPMTIEARVGPGERVRVRNGVFAGYEGIVDRRDAETRLIVSVQFMDRGVSVKLDDCQLIVI